MRRQLFSSLGGLCVLAMLYATASAGTFKTIVIDDAYADWVGVPVLDADAAGDVATGPDIGNTQIANDGANLYVRNTFHNSISLSTFIAMDVDQNTATGFDVFALGLIGSEAGWQNDFAFQQATGAFNIGGLLGPNFGGGHAIFSSFAQSANRELSISLGALFGTSSTTIFPDSSFDILIWTNEGDVSSTISYTLAVIPEPASCLLALMGSCVLIRRRRR